jgi:hypothetical protein
MKVRYNINSTRGKYEAEKFFTFGKEYKVLADYRNRQQYQGWCRDNGFVVIDNRGDQNMIFANEVKIIEDGKDCYTFSYK